MSISTEARRVSCDQVKPKVTRLQELILDRIREYGPITTRHLARGMDISILTARPRCTELLQAGLIKAVGRNEAGALYVCVPEEEARAVWEAAQKDDQLELL